MSPRKCLRCRKGEGKKQRQTKNKHTQKQKTFLWEKLLPKVANPPDWLQRQNPEKWPESLTATVLPGEGPGPDDKTQKSWDPGLWPGCWDTKRDSGTSASWAINIRDYLTSPLSQLRGFIPSSWQCDRAWQHQLCSFKTPLQCFILSRNLQGPAGPFELQ